MMMTSSVVKFFLVPGTVLSASIPCISPVVLALLLGKEVQRGYIICPKLHNLEEVELGDEPSKSNSLQSLCSQSFYLASQVDIMSVLSGGSG